MNAIEAMAKSAGNVVLTLRPLDSILIAMHRDILVDTAPDRSKASTVRSKVSSNGKAYAYTGYLLRDAAYIEIVVSDNGMGIAHDIIGNIFNPFFTTKARSGGAGLGLSTVQGYVTSGGGAMIIETLPDKGTDIHVYLPLAD